MEMPIDIRELPHTDLQRIAEIDRSEHVKREFEIQNGKLVSKPVDCHIPNWSDDPSHDFSVHTQIRQWAPVLEKGGVLLGAFEGDNLAGLAILRYRLTKNMAQLAFLHVSNGYRRKGIGTRLTEEVIRLARTSGACTLYVSATPSESAVGFYLSHGFQPSKEIHPELFEMEPDDIHMTRGI